MLLDHFDVMMNFVRPEQVPFVGFSAGIADHSGPSPGERDYMMSAALPARQREHGDHMPDMQRVGGWVESVIQRYGLFGEDFR